MTKTDVDQYLNLLTEDSVSTVKEYKRIFSHPNVSESKVLNVFLQ